MKKAFLLMALATANFVPSVASVPLPPRIIQKKLSWSENISRVREISAREIRLLSEVPIEHGEIEWVSGSSSQLRFNGAYGNRTFYLNTLLKYPKLGWSRGAFGGGRAPQKLSFANKVGNYIFEGAKIQYREASKSGRALFSIDVGFNPLLARASSGTFRAWASFPEPQFFTLNRFGSRGYQVKWSEDGQIVDVVPCTSTAKHFLLVDNVENGLTRFVFFDVDFNPIAHTIFDLGFDMGKSDVSRVLVRPNYRCEEIILAGAFGILKIIYPRAFLN